MILCFDSETTGLPDFNARARDPKQPHIVQLAMVAFNDEGEELFTYNVIVKPDGWTIPKEASDVHGITNEIAANGQPEAEVAAHLLACIRKAKLLVAHNVTFDKFIARVAMRRYNLIQDSDDAWWKALPTFCTMRVMTPICKIKGEWGFKWPKLQEAHKHCFGSEFDDAHDALADVRACARVYRWLNDKNPNQKTLQSITK